MSNALTALQLDVMASGGCAKPGCKCGMTDRMVLRSRCHPQTDKVVAGYEKGGRLVLFCSECRHPITAIAVQPS
jgi:hypothetical protein